MPQMLTMLQQSLIARLNLLGMEELAARARTAWSELRAYPLTLTPAEHATIEGARLCEDFTLANTQAQASMRRSRQLTSMQRR